jgi:hypothetical protein
VDEVGVWRWIGPLAGTAALLHSAQPVRRAHTMDPTRWIHAPFSRSLTQQDPPNQHGNQIECD